jgi:hypothetical protein
VVIANPKQVRIIAHAKIKSGCFSRPSISVESRAM